MRKIKPKNIPSVLFVGKDAKSRIAYLLHRIADLMKNGGNVEDYAILHDHIYSLLEKDLSDKVKGRE